MIRLVSIFSVVFRVYFAAVQTNMPKKPFGILFSLLLFLPSKMMFGLVIVYKFVVCVRMVPHE